MDLGDLDSVRKAAAQILREKGRLDILVNCAAKGRCDPPVMTIDGHEEMYYQPTPAHQPPSEIWAGCKSIL